MKKIFEYASAVLAAVVLTMGMASCSSDDDDDDGNAQGTESAKVSLMTSATSQYINNVVYPTYTNLANYATDLYADVEDLYTKAVAGTLTQSDINEACTDFLAARAYWEKSEAWLYGPADIDGIDPHIDSWPLSKQGWANFFKDNYSRIFYDGYDIEDAIVAVSNLNDENSWLGFHGLEFVLFRDGSNRTLSELLGNESDSEINSYYSGITGAMELNFARAIAGDLRDQCCRLEASWLGTSSVSSDHAARVTKRAFNMTYNGYGALMLNNDATLFRTPRAVMVTILTDGCSNICAEVADQKMGQVYRTATGTGSEEDSRDYIESPYSHMSFQDFFDNIISIRNSLYGNIESASVQTASAVTYNANSNSIMAYLNTYNSSLADELKEKLQDSFSALTTCQNYMPFVTIASTGDSQGLSLVKAAMDAVTDLDETLVEASDWISKN